MNELSELKGRMRALRNVKKVRLVNLPKLSVMVLRFAFVNVKELEMENASLLESHEVLGEVMRKKREEERRREEEERRRREEEKRRREEEKRRREEEKRREEERQKRLMEEKRKKEEREPEDDLEEVDIDEMGVRNESEEEEEEREDVWKNGPHPVDRKVDPKKNYIRSYSKEGVGRFMKNTKRKITWELVIEGEEHTIAVYHSQLSGKKVLLLDGDTEYEEAEFFDAGLDYTFPFRIEGREVSVLISAVTGYSNAGWNYDILIDGVSLNELQEQRSMGAGGGYEEDEDLFY